MCHPRKSAILLVAVLLGLILNNNPSTAAPLVLFEDTNFKGVRTEYILGGSENCINIRGKLNDFFSSVQSSQANDCFLICEHEFCRGRCITVTNSVPNLQALQFNDMISSIRRCSPATTSSTQSPQQVASESSPTSSAIILTALREQKQLNNSQNQIVTNNNNSLNSRIDHNPNHERQEISLEPTSSSTLTSSSSTSSTSKYF